MQQQNLTYLQAIDIIGGSVSKPSKMPWFGWSTSAFACQTGSKLREIEGSVCSKCYACKGNYTFKNVQQSHANRLKGIEHPQYVEAMILVIKTLYGREKRTYLREGVETKENRWRWHDSGDIQSVYHLIMINEIANACPEIEFWLPTKEAGYVSKFMKSGNIIADNLTIRLSAPMIGQTYKKKPNGLNFSTVKAVGDNLTNCPAPAQGNKCLDCRNCWNKKLDGINYNQH